MESAGEEDLAVSISAVGAVAYICCTVTFVLLVCLLFFLGLTPTQSCCCRCRRATSKIYISPHRPLKSMGCCTGAKPCVTVNSSLEVETLEEASCSLEPDEAEDEEVTLAPRPSPVPAPRAAVTSVHKLTSLSMNELRVGEEDTPTIIPPPPTWGKL